MTKTTAAASTAGEIPADAEVERLQALHWYDLAPGRSEPAFEDLVRLAASLFATPMSFVSVVEHERVRFLASTLSAPREVEREGSFCAAAILGDDVLVVPDAAADPRFSGHSLVTGEAGVRFYAGAPVRTPEGHRIGTLGVLDREPRTLTDEQRDALRILADQVSEHVAKRRHTKELGHRRAILDLVRSDLSRREAAVRRIVETAARTLAVDRVGLWFYDDARTAIVVEDLYIRGEDRHESGARLLASAYPNYFAALAESRVIAADDARADPRTSEFTRSYLDPNRVLSMLDVPVRSEGMVVGVLCHENTGLRRAWTPAEQEFAASIADLVGTVVEASRRRDTEAELRRLAAGLERRVDERTADLEESNRALVRAVGDLEAFCYSVSHDLRGPLRVINGFATLLEQAAGDAGDADSADAAARIRDNTRRMSELLDGLLAFFRLGRRPMEPRRVDMDALLRDTMASLDLDTGPTRVHVEHLEPTVGDPALLAEVMANLLTNAFKFSAGRPSPRVEVGCEVSDDEVVYHVRDNGVGFRQEHAARLFEPFQRLHAGDGYEGTGVGLAIVRRIVERHGGRVWAESAPAHGATFCFALPAAGESAAT